MWPSNESLHLNGLNCPQEEESCLTVLAEVCTLLVQKILGKSLKDLEYGKAYDYAALKTIKPKLSFTT